MKKAAKTYHKIIFLTEIFFSNFNINIKYILKSKNYLKNKLLQIKDFIYLVNIYFLA
jgi:hypothetical protein